MAKSSLFTSLDKQAKVDFFLKCQSLLVEHHPDSEFIFRQDNWKSRMDFAKEFINDYKGYVYSDDNICILFNYVFIKDPQDPIRVIKEHLYQPPQTEYNAVSVDFVVFKKLLDCMDFCQKQYDDKVTYLVFVKNNEVKIYETKKLLERAANVVL